MLRNICFVCFSNIICFCLINFSSALRVQQRSDEGKSKTIAQGRFTNDINDHEVVLPHKTHPDGSFYSYKLPHHVDVSPKAKYKNVNDGKVHYKVNFNGIDHHLKLEPSVKVASSNLIIEKRKVNFYQNVSDVNMKRYNRNVHCHYKGYVDGHNNSKVIINSCNGLVGSIHTNHGMYYIEPLANHYPQENGKHLHVIHKKTINLNDDHQQNCEDDRKSWNEYQEKLKIAKAKKRNAPSGMSQPFYLRALVVADLKFIKYHNDSDSEAYILTILDMAADYFHDGSVGNLLDISVVRIIFLELEKEEIDLDISPDAPQTLKSFCRWQGELNPKDPLHPNHHDVAILLTRHDLCSDSSSCSLLGLAYLAAACDTSQSCTINEDRGLELGIVVAHELGHVMGAQHDSEEETGCNNMAPDESSYVMSPYVQMHTSIWSPCSQKAITEYIESFGECLWDPPPDYAYEYPEMPPGAVYSADYQCKLNFGQNFPACRLGNGDKFCQALFCQSGPTKCQSRGEPPADGTDCGAHSWCFEKQCVEIGERPAAVNGEWGPWSSYGACTRSCGGGIAESTRECDNPQPLNRGRYCVGRRKRYQMCNVQACVDQTVKFRDSQCMEFNNKTFNGKLYEWIAYTPPKTEGNPCSLYCINTNRVFSKLAPRVKDGTKCRPGTRDTCISGKCERVGCDYVIGSSANEDACGICKGDGSHCEIFERLFTQPEGRGYVGIAILPVGIRNVLVEKLSPSENMLALSQADNQTFYLNGNLTEGKPGEYDLGGSLGLYSKPEELREEIHIKGPTTEQMTLWLVYFGERNLGIKYKYALPSNQALYSPTYEWSFLQWEDCSTRCGRGIQVSKAECVENFGGRVSSEFCSRDERPSDKTRVCNIQDCKARWKVRKWGPCIGCTANPGIRKRSIDCVKEAQSWTGDEIIVDPQECTDSSPVDWQYCTYNKTCIANEKPLPVDADDKFGGTLFKEKKGQFSDSKQNKTKEGKRIIISDFNDLEEEKVITIELENSVPNSMNLSEEGYMRHGDVMPTFMEAGNISVETGSDAINTLRILRGEKLFKKSKKKWVSNRLRKGKKMRQA